MKSRVTDLQRQILRALQHTSALSASQIADKIGVTRATLMAFLSDDRSIGAEKLAKLRDLFGITDGFSGNPKRNHFLRVGADIEPLRVLLTHVFPSSQMSWIADDNLDEETIYGPATGLFLFTFERQSSTGGVFVLRDRFRIGKGFKMTVHPDNARSLLPEQGDPWTLKGGSVESSKLIYEIDVRNSLLHAFDLIGRPNETEEIDILVDEIKAAGLGISGADWSKVKSVAMMKGFTPEQVIDLIERARPGIRSGDGPGDLLS